MGLVAIGLNHQSAPIDIREQLSVPIEAQGPLVLQLLQSEQISEAIIVSTCNRTELYLCCGSLSPVIEWLRTHSSIPVEVLQRHSYYYQDQEAVRHLMKVASGLNSMVLGEVEILGQLKSSFQMSKGVGGVGKILDRLFQYAFKVAKTVRSNTNISVNPVSVAYAAVSLSRHVFTDLSQQTVLLVGAGDTARLILKHLQSIGVKKIILANRTLQHAMMISQDLDITCDLMTIDLAQLPVHLPKADIVISSTASPLPILGKGMVESALKVRRHKPVFMVDIAVPRDIEPEVGMLQDVYLYCIDDLKQIVTDNQAHRRDAALQAELIIAKEVDLFMAWMLAQKHIGVVRSLRHQAREIKTEILKEGLTKLTQGQAPEKVLEHSLHRLLNRLLHHPTKQTRLASFEGDEDILHVASQLFNVNRRES